MRLTSIAVVADILFLFGPIRLAYAQGITGQWNQIWDQVWSPYGGVVVGALLILLGNLFKKWVSKAIEAIGMWVYGKLSGNRLLRRLALRKYRMSLEKKLENVPIPFRIGRPPMAMNNLFVPLKFTNEAEVAEMDALQAVRDHNRLMVVGEPGSGKSMLLKHIAYMYATGHLIMPNQPVPVVLELRKLSNSTASIPEHIVEEFENNDFPNAGHFVENNLASGNLLILLDGLDEVNSDKRPQVIQQIRDLLDRYKGCRAVITCRVAVYRGEFDLLVSEKLAIAPFIDQQIRRFLGAWKMPHNKTIEQLMRTLREKPRILALARNPLLLTIVAFIYTDTPHVLPHSRADFYEKSTELLLGLWDVAKDQTNRFDVREKRAVLRHLALFIQTNAEEEQRDRRTIDYPTALEQVRERATSLGLDALQDAKPLLDEIVDRSGLLLSIDGGQRFQFAHLTLQEYFAAAQLLANPEELIKRFRRDPPTWHEPVQLWCGLADESTELIRQVRAIEPTTAFECLADAKTVDDQLATQILNEFSNRLGEPGEDGEAITKAFGAVAADTRPRGRTAFNFLTRSLWEPDSAAQQRAAIEALVYTNSPEAAQWLADAAHGSEKRFEEATRRMLRDALVLMGDLAVPALTDLLNHGHVRLMQNFATTPSGEIKLSSEPTEILQDLIAVGTPSAAEALFPLLWHSDESTATDAAYALAALLPKPNVANVLQGSRLNDEQQKAPYLEWVWQPFLETSSDTPLPIVAGRAAYLMDESDKVPAFLENRVLDKRLVIPLAILSSKSLELERAIYAKEEPSPGLRALLDEVVASEAEDGPSMGGRHYSKELGTYALSWSSRLRDEAKERPWRWHTQLGTAIQYAADTPDNVTPGGTADIRSDWGARYVQESLITLEVADSKLAALLNTLRPRLRFHLFRRLLEGPTRYDWINVNKPPTSSSWAPRLPRWRDRALAVLTTAVIGSGLVKLGMNILGSPNLLSVEVALYATAALFMISWLILLLWEGFNELDFNEFVVVGLIGPVGVPALLVLGAVNLLGRLLGKPRWGEPLDLAMVGFLSWGALAQYSAAFFSSWLLSSYLGWQAVIAIWAVLISLASLAQYMIVRQERLASAALLGILEEDAPPSSAIRASYERAPVAPIP